MTSRNPFVQIRPDLRNVRRWDNPHRGNWGRAQREEASLCGPSRRSVTLRPEGTRLCCPGSPEPLPDRFSATRSKQQNLVIAISRDRQVRNCFVPLFIQETPLMSSIGLLQAQLRNCSSRKSSVRDHCVAIRSSRRPTHPHAKVRGGSWTAEQSTFFKKALN